MDEVVARVDESMRTGNVKGGYMAIHAALERYPTSKKLRGLFDKVIGHVLEQPMPGAGDLYEADLIRDGVARRDAVVLQERFNLTVMDEFVTPAEAAGLVALRSENEHTSQPALWCLSWEPGANVGPRALRKLLEAHGLPTDAMKVTTADFTGARGQCLRPRASAHLSELLAGKGAYSSSLSFKKGSHPAIDAIARRVESELGLLDVHGASWMITKYSGKASYNAHTDCLIKKIEGLNMDRVATVLIYLTDTKGGATSFTNFEGTAVPPSVGKAVAWRNLERNGDCMPFTEHEALPLLEGSSEKIILQRWYHAEASMDFHVPREAPDGVPEWEPGMNPIVCDDPMKCRMYNEWTNF
jgi:hypothetical protein